MDMTEVTRAERRPLDRTRRRFRRPTAPASVRAQVALTISAFVLGGVLSDLLFVGVWRHTAAEGDRARQAQAESRLTLKRAQEQLATAQQQLAASRAAVRALAARRTVARRELAALRRRDAAARASLSPRLRAIAGGADALTRESAKLDSALATLDDYIRNASGAGVDPAYLAAQVAYLRSATGRAKAAAATLVGDASQAQASAKRLAR
jgi:chromosome segregation ATPase